jgi:hypothetical protein
MSPHALGIVGALMLFSGVIGAQAPTVGPEPVVVNLQVGRLATRTIFAEREEQTAWLPIDLVADVAEFHFRRQAGGVTLSHDLTGTFVFNAGAGLRKGESGWLVDSDTLASVLSTRILVDWKELTVSILDPSTFPIAHRLDREMRRELAMAARPTVDLSATARRPLIDGLTFEYGIGLATRGTPARWSVTTGTSLLGGGLAVTVDGGDEDRLDGSWTTAWTDKAWLAQLRVGDGLATGPNPRTIRGVTLSNAPLLRSEDLGTLPVGGMLGSDWQVEAWRGGRLVGIQPTDAMGRFRFDVPVRIGENPVDLVAYGPGGEVRHLSRSVNLTEQMVGPGRWQYGLALGACRTARCSASLNADLRFGMAPGWIARAGYDHFARTTSDLQHPYLGVSGYLGGGLWFDADQTFQAATRGGLRYEPTQDFRASLEASRFDDAVTDPILTPEGRLGQLTGLVHWTPAGSHGVGYLELAVDRVQHETATSTSTRLSGSLRGGKVRLLPNLRYTSGDHRTDEFAVGMMAMVLPINRLPGILGRTTFRLHVDGTPAEGMTTGAIWASTRATPGMQLELGTTWRRGLGSSLVLRSSATLGGARIYNTVLRREDGGLEASPYIRGGVSLDPVSGAMHFSPDHSGERAGVSGRVWIDENLDGRFDADESPAEGVRVVIGDRTARTDASGFYQVLGLTPYLPVATAIDSASLPSPLLIPTLPRRGIAVAPYRVERLDIPLMRGGVLDGVIQEADLSPAEGVEVELVHLESGARQTALTYSDGGVYLMGLQPGAWRVSAGAGATRVVRIVSSVVTPLRIRRPAP